MCHVHWVDMASVQDRLRMMHPWQRINHFPGMTGIARKARLAQNLEKMRRQYPRNYSFYPRTWCLPLELAEFRSMFDAKGHSSKIFIIKPDAGCQGRGIFLTQDFGRLNPMESVVAQQYIKKPLLIDGFKFDLRLYVLIASCSPLRMYLFHDGLVRLCTEEYVKPKADNLGDRCMHLTNYAVNKHNDNFVANEGADAMDVGSKRSLKWFMEWVAAERGDAKAAQLWQRVGSLCVKVIISILPSLQREYQELFEKDKHMREYRMRHQQHQEAGSREGSGEAKTGEPGGAMDYEAGSHCFELLGVDVMIDSALKPWLIEVNHLPSFATDSPLDRQIKRSVLEQTLRVVRAKPSDKRKYEECHRRETSQRLYGAAAGSKAQGGGPQQHRPVVSPIQLDQASLEAVRRRIEAVYAKHAPERVAKVPQLLKKYKGKEVKLAEAVEAKYADTRPPLSKEALADQPVAEEVQPELRTSRSMPTSPRVDYGEAPTPATAVEQEPAVPVREPSSAGEEEGDEEEEDEEEEEEDDEEEEEEDGEEEEEDDGEEEEEEEEEETGGAAEFIQPAGRARGALSARRPGGPRSRDSFSNDQRGIRQAALSSEVVENVNPETKAPSFRQQWKGGTSDEAIRAIVADEDELLEDFDRIFPLPEGFNPKMMNEYEKLMDFAFEHEEKRRKRMMCPLQQRRGNALEFLQEPMLPPIGHDGEPEYTGEGRNLFGNPFLKGRKQEKPAEPRVLPKPGPKQAKAADRLMKGFSSKKADPAVELAADLGHEFSSRLAGNVAYAKEWRQRVEETKMKRATAVALKPKTFAFVEDLAPPPYQDERADRFPPRPGFGGPPGGSRPRPSFGLGFGVGMF